MRVPSRYHDREEEFQSFYFLFIFQIIKKIDSPAYLSLANIRNIHYAIRQILIKKI